MSTAKQPELLDWRPEPPPGAARLPELLAVLRTHGGWITRRELEACGFKDRELREISEADENADIFSYPGSPGYKLFSLVEDGEFDACAALKTQGEKMTEKWLRFQRRWHRSLKRNDGPRGDADASG